ncbi:MAG TPA: glycoside hydrolase family 2 protein [Ramlibacter sp.]|nr:glycoside hydrolase family 2 protein [Ramlibacter sp.]
MPFAAEWSICPGGSEPGDTEPPGGGWIAIDTPTTVADALRQRGLWSLDGPRRDFDDECWWFRARFDAPERATLLRFDGIASAAQAWLNGEPILSSTNMFIAHRCDVEKLMRAAGNELLVRCASLNAQLKAKRARPRWRTPMVTQQQLRWQRTTLLGRTPGWSPPAAPVGLWRDVSFGSRDRIDARDVRVDARVEGNAGLVRCRVESHPNARLELRLSRDGREWRTAFSGEGELRIDAPQLWWPHTHGEPALYDAALIIEGGAEVPLPPVGFRTIEVDTSGGGFHVRVNGEAVFCRGAVWMPLDVVSLRASVQQYEAALAQVKAAGMNMLRVAGITVYEEDGFYDACDRAGVLVWQEFMFANMDYPRDDEAFTASVTEEVRQQLARWGSHPCIAVVCGNSEAEQQAAMWGAPRDSWEHPLFHETIANLCKERAASLPYWPSSAHGGALPQQPETGTTSYYGVGAYLRPLEDARRSGLKFATECLAFANMPPPSTIARMPYPGGWKDRTSRDLLAPWDFEDVRDHYLEQLFEVHARELRGTQLDRYRALSRVATAEVMAAAFSEWRRPGSACGGALVLMLRDLWAGAGWGVVDDQGVPKACWHALRRVLQPVAMLITDEGLNGLHLHATNETPHAQSLRLKLRAWHDGHALVANAEAPIELAPRASRTIAAASLLDHFVDLNWSHRFGPPPCDVVSAMLVDAQGHAISRAHHFPSRPALAACRDIGLQARVVQRDNFACRVAVTAQRFAYDVNFEVQGMTAVEDHFHLDPGDEVRVTLRGTARAHARGWVHALNACDPVAIEGELA